ncbi:MAG: choice-of-anchor B family protein [Planctomycetota bacterium]
MIDSALRAIAPFSLGLALAATAPAHEDDPKILDRKPPVPGTGYRAATGQALGGGTAAAGLGFPAQDVTLTSWLTLGDLGYPSANGNDCWGYTSPSGREYALMCTTQGTAVVEITNAASPVVVGRVNGPQSVWRDVKVFGERAYVVSEGGGGIQVIDLTSVDSGSISLENSVDGPGTSQTHNIVIDEDSGFLYRTGGGNNGLRIYSLANPSQPQFVGQWNTRYVHDAQVVTYTSGPYAGREIAYCCSGFNGGGTDTGLTVLDVTNKSSIQVLSQLPYPGRRYSHQGWLSADRTRFYLGDELDEGNTVGQTTTRVFDVADPANVSYIGAFANGEAAVGHNMYERDGLLFQANYTSGLRVFDLNQDLNNPPEVAFFDTAPDSSSVTFNGLWSCFVDFPSGAIIGSDIERGLFVLRYGPPELAVDLATPAPSAIDPSGESVTVEITELEPGALDTGSPTLIYDLGLGETSVPLVPLGGTSWSADFPATTCGTEISWYVTVSSLSGQITNLPATAPGTGFISRSAVSSTVAREDDMETVAGWTSGAAGDSATTGAWTRGNPNGTAAQPEDDSSAVGARCWFTGQSAPGASVGENDIDDGRTTLLTPILDLASLDDPVISYDRWYSNDRGNAPNADVFDIDISNDGGANWTRVERIGPSGPGTSGGWITSQFRVADIVPPTAQVQMRFVASDLGDGSIVEAAIDEFRVEDFACGDGIGLSYCDASVNSTGGVATIVGSGSTSLAANDLQLTAISLPFATSGYFIVSASQGFLANPGGSQGNLCVGGNTGRYISQLGNSGFFGTISLVVDATAIPQPSGVATAAPGETWNFQCWYRDANPGVTSNFTRGYAVTFE